MSTTEWMLDARCAEIDPDIFFPPDKHVEDAYEDARYFCDRCRVQEACLAFAFEMREEHGMWGGQTPKERQRFRDLAEQIAA